mgnify:CR=1 FL=1
MEKELLDGELAFYEKQCAMAEDDINDSIDMVPHVVVKKSRDVKAWTSFALGIISSLAWIVPISGLPVTIVGIVLGAVSMNKKNNSGIAIAGFVINLVFLVCTIVQGIIDIIFYFRKNSK